MNLRTKIAINFISLLLNFHSLQAEIYYVDTISGDDSFSGTEVNSWKTINKAAQSVQAGDTVYIKAGNYILENEIIPKFSGTANQPILYIAYPGDAHKVIIDGRNLHLSSWGGLWHIDSKNHLKISGLSFITSSYAGILIENSSHITITDCQTDQTYSSGISVWNSENISINNNQVRRACWPSGGEQECISISGSTKVIVQNNLVYDGGSIGYGGGGEGIDFKDGCAQGVIINNEIHDIASVGIYIDAYKNNQQDIYVANNKIYNISGVGIAAASEEGGTLKNINISKNIVYKCEDRAAVIHWTNKPDYIIENIFLHHNTFFENAEGLDVGAHSKAKNIHITNNIFSQNKNYQLQNSSTDLDSNQLKVSGNLFYGDNPSWAVYGTEFITDNPMFIDEINADFHLKEVSPAIDKGVFLSKTLQTGNNTNLIYLNEAGFFSDGFQIFSGEKIKIEGDINNYTILNINSDNNFLEIDSMINYTQNQGVSIDYEGTRPDIGAFEYDPLANTPQIENTQEIKIYPNPAKEYLHIPQSNKFFDYELFTIHGKIISKGKIKSQFINVTNLEKGVYLIKINNVHTGQAYFSVFIKN